MLLRPGLSEELYHKYSHPAFPDLAKPPKMFGLLDKKAFEIAFGLGIAIFEFTQNLIFGPLVFISVAVALQYWLSKDPLILKLAPKLRGTKKYHTPWYRTPGSRRAIHYIS